MNILILSGGSGNDSLIRGLKEIYPDCAVKVLVNAYDAGKSTGICRKVTDTLGVSDIRKNHSRMYKATVAETNKCFLEFYDSRYTLTKGHEVEEVIEKLHLWGLDSLSTYARNFFARQTSSMYDYTDFNISNIIYSEMYAELGYEETNRYFTSLLGIEDFVILNSFDNVYIQAVTENGAVIRDEGDIVEYKNPNNKIVQLTYVNSNLNITGPTLNPAAIHAIEDADLIVISTGTFWSSIYPTLDYGDLYKYINQSNAKKIWAINNLEDADAYDVSSNDFINIFSTLGLDLSQFTILENKDAIETLRQPNSHFNIALFSMGNTNGKHNAVKYAEALFRIFYGLEDVSKFKYILFDFDDTLWARDKSLKNISIKNVQMVNTLPNAIIISGNSFESIRKHLSEVYGAELDGFKIDVWADANSTLFREGKRISYIDDLLIEGNTTRLINYLHDFYGITCTTNDSQNVSCLKIKPLTPLDQRLVADYLNDYLLQATGLGNCVAIPTGVSTVDIVSSKNNKSRVLEQIVCDYDSLLYVGDEVDAGNDKQVALKCGHTIRIHDVKETAVVLQLLQGANA